MIEGISHITFIVKDINQSTSFFVNVFDAKEVYTNEGGKKFSLSQEKFFLIGNTWIAIMQGNPLGEKTYNHIAFKISDEDLQLYKERLIRQNIEIKTPRTRVPGESQSIYFYDYDNHLFELHSGTLKERLEAYKSF